MPDAIPPSAPNPANRAPGPKKPGPPPAIDEYARGKLLICLSLGWTQREAAAWAGVGRMTVRTAIKNQEFNEDLKYSTTFARLHPLLRMYQASGESWKVAARLLVELDERFGPLSTDDLMEGISLMLDQASLARRASRGEGEG